MNSRVRIASALGLAALFVVALAAVQEGSAVARTRHDLSFRRGVALSSFSPLRTFVSDVYSLEDGNDPPHHEWQGEPVIDVDGQNDIYIGTTCCVGPSSPVWASYDDGRSFQELDSPGNFREWFTPGSEGTLTHDGAGHVYFADTYAPGLIVSAWENHGQDWQYSTPSNGVVPGLNDRPWLAWSSKTMYLYVNYGVYVQVYDSADGGLTWSTQGPLTWKGDLSGQPFFPGHIAADRKSGTLWVDGLVPHGTGKHGGAKYALASAVTRDRGKTYTQRIVATAERRGGFTPQFVGATAVDRAGTGYTTWATWDRHGCDVYYAASTDEGRSWNLPVKVSRGPGCATFPWIAAHRDGRIAVVWYQTPFHETKTKKKGTAYQDKVGRKAPWYLHAAAVTRAHSSHPRIVRTRVDTDGPVVRGPLERKLWDFFQVAIGPDGRMDIAYSKFVEKAPKAFFTKNISGPRL
jgi:hypothetical protein